MSKTRVLPLLGSLVVVVLLAGCASDGHWRHHRHDDDQRGGDSRHSPQNGPVNPSR